MPLQSAITEQLGDIMNEGCIIEDPEMINLQLENLIKIMIQCSNNLVKKRVRKGEKPFWNKQLSNMGKETKALWKLWDIVEDQKMIIHHTRNTKKLGKDLDRRDEKAEIIYEQLKIQE